MAATIKQIILQLLIFATITSCSEVISDINEKESNFEKHFEHELIARAFRSRRQTSGNSGFSNTFGEPAQQNSGQNRPSQNKRPTPRPQTTSTTSSANSEAQIVQCIRNCRFVNFADYVCASDGVTYMNEPHFNCAVKCGRRITIQYRAACAASNSEQSTQGTNENQSTTSTTSRPQVSSTSASSQPQGSSTTNSAISEAQITQCIRNCRTRFVNFADYVCGSDGVTYMNEPHFNCVVKCGRKITIQYRSSCG